MDNSQLFEVVLEKIISLLKNGADKSEVIDYINNVQAQLTNK